jgi:hypothetical protein
LPGNRYFPGTQTFDDPAVDVVADAVCKAGVFLTTLVSRVEKFPN